MDNWVINGGSPLCGEVEINGAKNSCLPLMAASLLVEGKVELLRVPSLKDVEVMKSLLIGMGIPVRKGKDKSLIIESECELQGDPAPDLGPKLRASICLLGPVLARRGYARFVLPGGCVIGPRPIDLHLKGLRALGAEIFMDEGGIVARSEQLKGAHIDLRGPWGTSVLATANVMMASVLAKGETVVENAALEPEIDDLIRFLNQAGANIIRDQTKIIIQGRNRELLKPVQFEIMADRVEAGTYLIGAAVTRGRIKIKNVTAQHLNSLIGHLRKIGEEVNIKDNTIELISCYNKKTCSIKTAPYPGFPTDLQPQLMVLLCLAQGQSQIEEGVYPERFTHVEELCRMGVEIKRNKNKVLIQGTKQLVGTHILASDLRASAALVMAGLVAQGETILGGVSYLERGYEDFLENLSRLGAQINVKRESFVT